VIVEAAEISTVSAATIRHEGRITIVQAADDSGAPENVIAFRLHATSTEY
jgi:hypothetical protein